MLLRGDGALLLQHRDDKPGLRAAGQWVPPGGHCEEGETMEQCARRELREETDYRCDELMHFRTIVNDFEKNWPVEELTIFWDSFDGVQSIQCHEGQALKFVMRNEVADYTIPDYVVQLWDELKPLVDAKKRERNKAVYGKNSI